MTTGQINSTVKIGETVVTKTVSKEEDGSISSKPLLAAGVAGTLSTRTDDNTGVATLTAGHGITDSDTVDVYWDGGLRYGMGVTLVAGDDVSVDLGDGDVLPAQSTVLVACKRQELDVVVDGDKLVMLLAHSVLRAHIEFLTDADASIVARELTANDAWAWASGEGVTNPLAGQTVGKVQASCGEVGTSRLRLVVLYDSSV